MIYIILYDGNLLGYSGEDFFIAKKIIFLFATRSDAVFWLPAWVLW